MTEYETALLHASSFQMTLDSDVHASAVNGIDSDVVLLKQQWKTYLQWLFSLNDTGTTETKNRVLQSKILIIYFVKLPYFSIRKSCELVNVTKNGFGLYLDVFVLVEDIVCILIVYFFSKQS